ncbi:hypothetical protein E0L93_13330 [Rubrobacter taiwanensis]|jgi:hypothetical protein|uniref:Uncharacterized protein n=1 Tax=Rubrobacter taiwanensis TaxID=185139 RepID=A0A4R1BDJ3_9ACTN|nr:hypothetical protein [Rubrobacter taiwanensis]TCJ15133.1 hypothetical protein E0L93_13330 [Rubrobacter taiwanensis]
MILPAPDRRPEPLDDLSPQERRRILLRALRRPMAVLVLVLGGVIAATTLELWPVPLTLITYVLLVFLATRDPVFQRRALGLTDEASPPARNDISPERRARWLPRGRTRERVDAALDAYRKAVAAIEGSNDVARAVLADAVPRLHTAADHLVDVAMRREKLSESIREAEHAPGREAESAASIERLKRELAAADAQIEETTAELLQLRLKVAEISLSDSGAARIAAEDIRSGLERLNAELDALRETNAPPEDR